MLSENDYGMCYDEEAATRCAREYNLKKQEYDEGLRTGIKIAVVAVLVIAATLGVGYISYRFGI